VCAGVFQEGEIYRSEPRHVCVLGTYMTAFSPLGFSLMSCSVFFPYGSCVVFDYPAAFNTCSSHRENTILRLEDDGGVGSAAS